MEQTLASNAIRNTSSKRFVIVSSFTIDEFAVPWQTQVQFFITAMDSVKLNMVACDQLHPLLADLMTALNRVELPRDYDGKQRVMKWSAFSPFPFPLLLQA